MSSQIYKNQIPQDWEVVKLEGIVEIYDNLRIPVAASLRKFGTTPYYGANGIQDYVDGFTHNGEFVLIAEDGANDLINYPVTYVNGEIWVNNHAHVVSGKNKIVNNKFLSYCLKITNFSKFIVGGTRTKLNGSILKNIEILLPKDKAEQERIAQVLSDMDDLISAKCELLDKKRAIKQGAVQQLLAPKPHWHTATLGVCVEIITPPSKINTIEYSKSGKFPIIDQSQDFICGWTDDDKKVIKISEPVIIFGDHTCVTKFVNFDFAQGADGIKILKSKKFLNPKFLYQLLQFDPIVPEMYKRHFSKLKGKKILYPKDKAEQKMIAQVLGDMDDEISALQDEIEKLKMIKQGAMDELLSGKIRLKG